MMRITMSVEEPAPNGTSTRIGFAGNCASADWATSSAAMRTTRPARICPPLFRAHHALGRFAVRRAVDDEHLDRLFAGGGELMHRPGREITHVAGMQLATLTL